ncbi:unnamed protein product [Pylaiella littoralis]
MLPTLPPYREKERHNNGSDHCTGTRTHSLFADKKEADPVAYNNQKETETKSHIMRGKCPYTRGCVLQDKSSTISTTAPSSASSQEFELVAVARVRIRTVPVCDR